MWYALEAAATLGPEVSQLQRKAERAMQALTKAAGPVNRWVMARDAGVTEVLSRPACTDVEEDVFGTEEPAKDLCRASIFFSVQTVASAHQPLHNMA